MLPVQGILRTEGLQRDAARSLPSCRSDRRRRGGPRPTGNPLPRPLCDCFVSASFADALAYADGAIRVTSLSAERLGDAVRALNPRPHHAERVLDVLTHADGRSEAGQSRPCEPLLSSGDSPCPIFKSRFHGPSFRTVRYGRTWSSRDATGHGSLPRLTASRNMSTKGCSAEEAPRGTLADEQHREAQLTLLGMPIMRGSAEELRQPERVVRKLIAYDIPRRAA